MKNIVCELFYFRVNSTETLRRNINDDLWLLVASKILHNTINEVNGQVYTKVMEKFKIIK